jgi:hypothetical protein
MANWTTGLYDRRNDQVGLDEVERILIRPLRKLLNGATHRDPPSRNGRHSPLHQ